MAEAVYRGECDQVVGESEIRCDKLAVLQYRCRWLSFSQFLPVGAPFVPKVLNIAHQYDGRQREKNLFPLGEKATEAHLSGS